MFTNLFFLIIVLLLINLAPEIHIVDMTTYPFTHFLMGIFAYGCTLLIIIGQNFFFQSALKYSKKIFLLLANFELISFLCFYYFVIDGPIWFKTFPHLGNVHSISTIFSLILYLAGIGIFHSSAERVLRREAYAWSDKPSTAILELRLLIPFTFPFLIFTIFTDIIQLYPIPFIEQWFDSNQAMGSVVIFGATIIFMLAMLIFLPPLTLKAWQCTSLEKGYLRSHLEKLCESAQFHYADIKVWTIMNNSVTAAILGIAAPFRYIIFTKKLLDQMPVPCIEAVLVHEIGHHYRKHLLIYPLILMGLLATSGLFSEYFSPTLVEGLKGQERIYPSAIWEFLEPIEIFAIYSLLILIYFRTVFGFFSRLFERQADLHVFHLGIDPQSLIGALDFVGRAGGGIHNLPNWHHYSIQERIDFLMAAQENPSLIHAHHHYVKKMLVTYLILLGIGGWLLLASSFPTVSVFQKTAAFNQHVGEWIREILIG